MNGVFGTGKGEEYTDENRERGRYLPVWIDIETLSSIDFRPKEVALKLKNLLDLQGIF
ncbi:hypothetical protein [Lederbergia galactosidilytica]|uniref:hypothetical protein n=1 Tax=Lederbergia galactosidilytica TaxID=217031 RepID=UPI000A7738BD